MIVVSRAGPRILSRVKHAPHDARCREANDNCNHAEAHFSRNGLDRSGNVNCVLVVDCGKGHCMPYPDV